MIDDSGDLALVASLPFLLATGLGAYYGASTATFVVAVVGFTVVVPLVAVFGDRLLGVESDGEIELPDHLVEQYAREGPPRSAVERVEAAIEEEESDGDADRDRQPERESP